jgi:hydrogenase nickel incorporation protein HypA/HybF
VHELSVCQGMIQQVETLAAEHHADSATIIKVSVGPLSGVEAQLLAQAFPIAAAGTIAEHAALEIDVLPVRVRCRQCGAETDASANRLVCGYCGHWQTTLLSGDEMLLTSVEFEKMT